MPDVPNRARTHRASLSAIGPMAITCPACKAAPHWRCIAIAYDSDGNGYEQRKLNTPHKERKNAWRDRGKNKCPWCSSTDITTNNTGAYTCRPCGNEWTPEK